MRGLVFFWPHPLVEIQTKDGRKVLGEILSREPMPDAKGEAPPCHRSARVAVKLPLFATMSQ